LTLFFTGTETQYKSKKRRIENVTPSSTISATATAKETTTASTTTEHQTMTESQTTTKETTVTMTPAIINKGNENLPLSSIKSSYVNDL
jgi:uncharacterized GH25 family protein